MSYISSFTQICNYDKEVILASCKGSYEIQSLIKKILLEKSELPSKSKDSLILLKPNLNNDLNALAGGTTDLRILTAILKFLKNNGYRNVVIGDGPNVAMFHSQINVFSRLRIDKLAEKFGYQTCDFNYARFKKIDLLGNKVKIAEICFDRDYFINLPKIKTHVEAKLSICLKNLIGCLVGYDKRKIHLDIFERKRVMHDRILKLNEILRPDFHIVDGLIAMEGDGPGRGTPKKLDLIIAGTDALRIDSLCAKLTGFEYNEVPYLKLAVEKGLITSYNLKLLNTVASNSGTKLERPRKRSEILSDIFLRNLFVRLRFKWLDFLFSHSVISKLLIASGIRQDVIIKEDVPLTEIYVNSDECNKCGICSNFCPLNLPIHSTSFNFANSKCIHCLYCFFACPKKAIKLKGKLGYLSHPIQTFRLNQSGTLR